MGSRAIDCTETPSSRSLARADVKFERPAISYGEIIVKLVIRRTLVRTRVGLGLNT
ncbi:hypothetical protein DPMN_150314 [Dreissena polymorpha]|uniref:Uncharacterized protein n=1 Tax=Dreissena polymorpha TaxID=45954 RepID=A0A9D4J5V8_DREPO|nr:hypothetical protein DPMN_150314 [Dreissena polymorpha]